MRVLAALAIALAYIAFTVLILRSHRRRRSATLTLTADLQTNGNPHVLVAFASQTGFAEQLARQTAQSLTAAGVPAAIETLAALDAERLAAARHALFVVSTTGEGDAPDSASAFARRIMNETAELAPLRYGLLALGDREYRNFCGFGRRLDDWLRRRGAEPLFDPVEVDNGDEKALTSWSQRLAAFTGSAPAVQWEKPKFDSWRLTERVLANPCSAGQPTFYLGLEPVGPEVQWQAGDIAEIRPHNPIARVAEILETAGLDGREAVQVDGRSSTIAEVLARSVLPHAIDTRDPQRLAQSLKELPKRDFSIASLPADGKLDLLVRQYRLKNGALGTATGWLTEHAWIGAEIELRIRSNPSFHPPQDNRPLILIGNGTGIAGLRSLLKARAARGHRRNWLIFGERNAACDFYYRKDIETWKVRGYLPRTDMAFSRDQPDRVYVQHKLLAARDEVRSWIEDGAAIYICGSIEGMASGVEAAFIEILGTAAFERLTEENRYHRDVY